MKHLPIKLLPFLICAVLAVLMVPGGPDHLLGGDALYYDLTARELLATGTYAQGSGNRTVLRAPGYSIFLSLCYLISTAPGLVRVLQLGLLAISACAAQGVAARYFGKKAGLITGVLVAGYLPLVMFTQMHLGESLSTCLLTSAAWALSRERALAGGLFSTLASLVRPTLLFLPSLVLLQWRTQPRRVLAICACYVALFTPWLVRQYAACGSPTIGLSGNSAYFSAMQYQGKMTYQMHVGDWEIFKEDWVRRNNYWNARLPFARAELATDHEYYRDANRLYASISPVTLVSHLPRRLWGLWTVGDNSNGWLHRLAQGQHLLFAGLILVGVWSERKRLRSQSLLWWPAVFVTAIHLYYHVEPRYTFPARPLLLVYAAVGIIAILSRLRLPGAKSAPAPAG